MKLKDTGLTAQDIKDKVKKYMIETYERFDFIAETAEGMYLYDENGTPYLDFYAGIAVNNAGSRNPKVVAAVKDQVDDIMHNVIHLILDCCNNLRVSAAGIVYGDSCVKVKVWCAILII